MRFGLKIKTVVIITLTALILSGTALTISSQIIKTVVNAHYCHKAEELSKTITLLINTDYVRNIRESVSTIYDASPTKVGSNDWGSFEFTKYVMQYEAITKSRVYRALHSTLHYFQTENHVTSAYLIYVNSEDQTAIYLVDASEKPCPPGCFDYLGIEPSNLEILENPERGFPAFITKTEEYGWLVTAGVPVYDATGKICCYAMVDISMKEARKQQLICLLQLAAILAVLTVFICVIMIFIVNRTIAQPINTLSLAASRYCSDASKTEKDGFSEIDIHTGDEIEDLAASMKQMERDINKHIQTILATTEELHSTQQKALAMSELAQKDALTGLRNAAAYTNELQRLDESIIAGGAQFGIGVIDMNSLNQINDLYGQEKGDEAIRLLSSVICRIFCHSPVFRIDGDEFAVLIEKDEYPRASLLEMAFNVEIESLKNSIGSAWKRISAAIGVALFDPALDKNAEDVFHRASDIMAEHKQKMKFRH